MKPFKLDDGPRLETGFKAPDGYFEAFEDRIMRQLKVSEPKVVPLYRRRPVWAAAAAVIMGGLLTLYLSHEGTGNPDNSELIENYLVYQGDVNSYDLVQNLSDSDIAELEQSMAETDEVIADYLNNENITVTD